MSKKFPALTLTLKLVLIYLYVIAIGSFMSMIMYIYASTSELFGESTLGTNDELWGRIIGVTVSLAVGVLAALVIRYIHTRSHRTALAYVVMTITSYAWYNVLSSETSSAAELTFYWITAIVFYLIDIAIVFYLLASKEALSQLNRK